jgi:hypothetical protein
MAAAPPADRQPIIDIRFDDLVADPTRVVRRIYAQFGYRYSAAFEQEIARFMAGERAAARLRHTYTPEQFGLSRQQVIERSADYLAWAQQRCGELAEAGRAT